MREHDRLTGAPILVVDLSSVLGLDDGHGELSCTDEAHSGGGVSRRPGMTNLHQANVTGGRNRFTAPMITSTKNSSTRPCTTAKGGSDGGTLGASACRKGILRKLWITSTNTLR